MKWTTVLLVLSIHFANAQTNLVRNPGFELYSKCPYDVDQIHFATGWTPIDTNTQHNDSVGNPDCSAEYYNTCSTYWLCVIPNNPHFYQYPHSGNGMTAVFMYANYDSSKYIQYLRDYLQGRLTSKLTAGKTYCVSFYVNLAELSGYAIKEIGAYLDNGSIDNTNFCGIPQTQYTPQVVNTNGIITDTAAWTKIQGSFIANGTERFITIGNFKDRLHTTVVATPINAINNGSPTSYYLIDDVSVIAIDTKADAGPDTHVAEDSAFIGRPLEVGLECTWAVLGSSTVIGTGSGIKVKPSTTTSYVVTQILCGMVTRDTVKVDVWPAGISSVNGKEQVYTLIPNPVQQTLHLSQQVNDGRAVMVSIYEATGKKVYAGSLQFADNKAGVDVGGLASGFYFVELKDGSGNGYRLKLLKE